MMPDNSLYLSQLQAITASAESTYKIDTGAAGNAFSRGVWCMFLVTTAFTSNGATVQFALQTDSDTAFGTAVTLFTTPAIAVASLVKGYVPAKFIVPAGVKRYLRAYYTVASGPAAGGYVACQLLLDVDVPDANASFPG